MVIVRNKFDTLQEISERQILNEEYENFVTIHTIKPYLFILCLDYVLLTTIDPIKENGFTLKETRSR